VTASVFSGAHDFFHSQTWRWTWQGAVGLLLVFWLAMAYWVWKDARHRIGSRIVVGLVTILGFVPIAGPLVYMLFRPPEYLADVRERELEMQAIERRLMTRDCPVCRAVIEADYLVCPVCATKLRHACANCHKPLEPIWQVCPYCETPVAPAEQPVALRAESASRRTRKAT
jgi:RNA polymerase subunit RPABC4/transcription elongation factor Spt4